jgi:chloramphenicol-sensitive protein RarD
MRLAVAAYTLWGLLTVYWKQLAGFAALELIGWRVVFAAIVMVIVVLARGTWPTVVAALRDRRTLARLAVAGTLLAANWLAYVGAVVSDRVIETALGYFMAPLATMLIGVLVLGEQMTAAQAAAFGCAAAAVVVLTVESGPPWIAIVLAATWSAYGLATRRLALGPIEGLAGETFVLFAPAVGFLLVASLLGGGTPDGTGNGTIAATAGPADWLLLAGTGVVTAVPLMLFAAAAKTVPFTLLGPLNLLVPVINFGLGWAVYGEPMPASRLIGFAFVWVALGLVTFDRVRTARADRTLVPS